jgi:hypothetical protein
MRTLVLPEEVEHWLLTTLREKLVKIGARIVRHGRYVVFQPEAAVPRPLFAGILRRIDKLRGRPAPCMRTGAMNDNKPRAGVRPWSPENRSNWAGKPSLSLKLRLAAASRPGQATAGLLHAPNRRIMTLQRPGSGEFRLYSLAAGRSVHKPGPGTAEALSASR